MKAMITGGLGFVGRALGERLLLDGAEVHVTSRAPTANAIPGIRVHVAQEEGDAEAWKHLLDGFDVVFHLAARAHILGPSGRCDRSAFHEANVELTSRVAHAAAATGSRLVFLSSIGVHGDESQYPLRENSPIQPRSAYAESKWLGEEEVRRVASRMPLSYSVLRAPLVYGPYVRAKFLSLMKLVRSGLPLPFASVRNRRSLIYSGNLADALAHVARNPAAVCDSFLISDAEDLSTPELIVHIGAAIGRRARLFAFPSEVLRLLARAVGKSDSATGLLGSLSADISAIRSHTGWTPPHSLDTGIIDTGRWFLESRS